MSKTEIAVVREAGRSQHALAVPGSSGSDWSQINDWLLIYHNRSAHTLRQYVFQMRRWMAFLEYRHGAGLASYLQIATEEDVHAYLLAIGRPRAHRTVDAPAYVPVPLPASVLVTYGLNQQPFVMEQTVRSVDVALAVISSLYGYLSKSHVHGRPAYLSHHPARRLSKAIDRSTAKIERYFTPQDYLLILQTIDVQIQDLPSMQLTPSGREQRKAMLERRRWLCVMLFGLWLRVSEAASMAMGDFKLHGGVWMLTVIGKGNKLRQIEVTSDVMEAFFRYRRFMGFTKTRDLEPGVPAVLPVRRQRGKNPNQPPSHCDASTIYREVRAAALEAADALDLGDATGDEHEALVVQCARLRAITPHWFRHSGASEAMQAEFPLVDAAERLGHSDTKITAGMYYHGDTKRRISALETISKGRASHG